MVGGNSDGNIQTGIDKIYNDFIFNYSLSVPQTKSYNISFIKPEETKTNEIDTDACNPSAAFYLKSKSTMPFNLLQLSANIYSEFIDAKQTGNYCKYL